MSLNNGKQKKVYHTFLDKEYRIDELPCGVSIPFNIELDKLRKDTLLLVFKIDPKTPSSKLGEVLQRYLEDNPEEAYKQVMQMKKAVSVLTEFFTDGEVDEDYIHHNATDEEVSAFIEVIQEVQHENSLKKLKQARKNLQSKN